MVWPKVGDQYGELRIVSLLGSRRSGRVWLCACDCGQQAIRTSAALNSAVRNGRIPSCLNCANERRRGARGQNGDFWARLFREIGTVWPASSTERLMRRVGEDLDDEGHRSPADLPLKEELFSPCEHGGANLCEQRIAYLYPIQCGDDRLWECVDCREPFRLGLGCIECIEPVCTACVRAEKHRHPAEHLMTYDAIGRALCPLSGDVLSRERIRQILNRGLRSLRHPSRSSDLRDFA